MMTSLGALLVVDDEEMNRDMLSRRLQVEGFTVATASGGAEALRMMAEQQFDAILLDVMMPVQSGYEVLAEIRKSHTSLELPILMVTAKNHSEDIVNAFSSGANDYITKPINFPVALARINSHVASKRLSMQLRESETRYSLSARGANDGLWDWNLLDNKVFFSSRWKSMLGYSADAVGDSVEEWFDRVHTDDLPHVQKALAAHRNGETEQFESEHRMRHCDQTYRWVLTRGVVTGDATGRQTRMAGSQTDITRGKAADPLTGLPNRVLFMDHLDAAIKIAHQQPDFLFAVLFLDLDRFKVVNDSLGHHVGDELLVEVARRLESCMRTSDVVSRLNDRSTIARFGGDEFVLLLKGIKHSENAYHVASRILSVLSEPLTLRGHNVSVSASIGIAIGTYGGCDPNDLMRDADTAMYQAKSTGKSRVCMFDQAMRTLAIERLELEADLKQGLANGEFEIYYQPIVSLQSGRIEGFEALLRWQNPIRGMISPADFIPIAEETGYIVELGAWVLKQACRQLRIWQVDHPHESPLTVSVNVSSKQFADPTLMDRVADCLKETGLDARCLILEITESALMNDLDLANRALKQLHDLGVRISLDDFGTGYSSLSYLQQFPIDTIKIDRSFIQKLEASSQAEEIVRTIVALAHGLGMKVTAEGIESQSQLTKLHEITCETGQGYLYARPGPQSTIDALLKENKRYMANEQAVPV
jgi:diguanylate cyclase (GGDEF)-like protein/PAS domain S-box-containing protein